MNYETQTPVKVVDYEPRSFQSLGKGNWGEYFVTVEFADGRQAEGWIQGDTHDWAFDYFEEEVSK